MSNYQKGARFERDLVKELWLNGWAAVRAAGSGCVGYPVPDILAVRSGEILAIECKTTKKDRIYLRDAVLQLKDFRQRAGAKSYIAIKFFKEKPRFYELGEKEIFSIEDEYLSFDSVTSSPGRVSP